MIKGIGVDIVENERINLKIAPKILSELEYQYFQTINENLQIEMLASRFAAKEAIVKATNKKYLFSDINLEKNKDGALICTSIDNIHLSISHEKKTSIAFAVWEGEK